MFKTIYRKKKLSNLKVEHFGSPNLAVLFRNLVDSVLAQSALRMPSVRAYPQLSRHTSCLNCHKALDRPSLLHFMRPRESKRLAWSHTAGYLNLGPLYCFFDDGLIGSSMLLDLGEPQTKCTLIVRSEIVSKKNHGSDLIHAWATFLQGPGPCSTLEELACMRLLNRRSP